MTASVAGPPLIEPWQWALGMLCGIGMARVHALVFGPLSQDDRDCLRMELSGTLVQAAVAMACFREAVGWPALLALVPSLALKWFHRMVQHRLKSRSYPDTLVWLLGVLHVCDMAWMNYWYVRIYSQQGMSPLTLALLADVAVQWGDLVMATATFLGPSRLSAGFQILLAVYTSGLKLFIYFAMSVLLLSRWYLPAHIARDAFQTLRSTVNNLRLALSYRRGTTVYGVAHVDPLTIGHETCPICYDSLAEAVAVRTRCSHSMHLRCITAWLEVNPVCPMCRAKQSSGLRRVLPPAQVA